MHAYEISMHRYFLLDNEHKLVLHDVVWQINKDTSPVGTDLSRPR